MGPLSSYISRRLKSYMTRLMSYNATLRSCPAPAFPVLESSCRSEPCAADDECHSQNKSCCFNGCVFTCVEKVTPPPIIDWEEEPSLTLVTSEHDPAVRPCTNSPRPAPSEPVGCPKGYVCRIQDHGDGLSGTPNRGVCVPEASQDPSPAEESSIYREKTGKETVYLPGGCVLSHMQYKHMQDFLKRSYVKDCYCIEGSVECQVSL